MTAGKETLEPQIRVPANHFRHLRDGSLGKAAAGLEWERFSAKAELENNPLPVPLQRVQEGFIDIGSVNVPFARTGGGSPGQGRFHLGIRDRTKINVRRNVRGGGEDLRNALDVMVHRRMHIGEGLDRAFCRRAFAPANGRWTFRSFSPTSFQFVKSGVELAPLAAGEKAPLEGVLEALIVQAACAPGNFGPRANDIQFIQDGIVPCAILRALADQGIKSLPVAGGDGLGPLVKVAKDQADAPK